MIAKSGASLLQKEAVQALKKYLLPLTYVITPNIPEAEVITGMKIRTLDDKKQAAEKLFQLGVSNVIIKGGHDEDKVFAIDLLFDGKEYFFYKSKRVNTKNTHGTGCTFSAAITAELAKGANVNQAVSVAKNFITAAIEDEINIGKGHGPTNHWAYNRRGVTIV